MSVFFLDSNAVAKRYVPEAGQIWVQNLCDPTHGHALYISQMAEVEVVFALAKWTRVNTNNRSIKQRQLRQMVADREMRISTFRQHCSPTHGVYNVISVTPSEFNHASELCHTQNISPQDAIQLASALVLRTYAQMERLPSPSFVTADAGLIRIAKTYGFSILNPENYAEPAESNDVVVSNPSWRERLARWSDVLYQKYRELLLSDV